MENSEKVETKQEKPSTSQEPKIEEKPEIKYFFCEVCNLRERYDYFGNDPHFVKRYKLLENAYVIEDPFVPPKQGEFIILGAHCIKCNKSVCKDSNCSFYYEGTFCIYCAKNSSKMFPQSVQDKLNKIIVT